MRFPAALLLILLVLACPVLGQPTKLRQLPVNLLAQTQGVEGIYIFPEGLALIYPNEVWSAPWELISFFEPQTGRVGLMGASDNEIIKIPIHLLTQRQETELGTTICQAAALQGAMSDVKQREPSTKPMLPEKAVFYKTASQRPSVLVSWAALGKIPAENGISLLAEGLVVKGNTSLRSLRWSALHSLTWEGDAKEAGFLLNAAPALSLTGIQASSSPDKVHLCLSRDDINKVVLEIAKRANMKADGNTSPETGQFRQVFTAASPVKANKKSDPDLFLPWCQ